MNATTNYQLSQWEAEDRVLRTDFNADNAKIEAALSSLEERTQAVDALTRELAFYVGRLATLDLTDRKKYMEVRSMYCEGFLFPQYFTRTGGIEFTDGKAVLAGTEPAGTIAYTYQFASRNWTRARMYIVHSDGEVRVKLNGVYMTPGDRCAYLASDTRRTTQEFNLTGGPGSNVEMVIEMDRGSRSEMKLYEYSLFVY